MQKQPTIRRVFDPVALPKEFPLRGGEPYHQGDGAITYHHKHDCLELGYCCEGSGIFVIAEKVWPFRTGDISVIGSGHLHRAQSARGTQSMWYWIYLDPARLLAIGFPNAAKDIVASLHRDFCHVLSPGKESFFAISMREIIKELSAKRPLSRTALSGLIIHLMVQLARMVPKRRRSIRGSASEKDLSRIERALNHVTRHYEKKMDQAMLAKLCHSSPTNFRRMFKRATGQTPARYITEIRIRMAASLLKSGQEKIVQIAHNVGFETLSSFNRSFRQVMKCTPSSWRKS